ncbi:MAG: SipW-dependent-type signal peptide-containing protein [Oscillibacter sp.]|nr:SipW-dependent-type signal peptide-containing protein [Oscillibacter sp.]
MNNNQKATKRARLTSVMALVMCVVMLVGTTFAWFTDTASTAVNKIQSGNLDVALEMSTDGTNWESAEGKTLTFKTKDNRAADQILWEPGCTYELPQLRVVNKGNLALKYKICINGIQGDAKLNEVIDWTINGAAINLTEEHLLAGQTGTAFTIKGHMQESAGNEYQGLTIDGIGITVVATQYTHENDSNGNTYDENADYTIHVNKDNIQDYLDGKYGSIDGMTLVLAAGNYDKLELGRATKYSGSNTDYYIGGVSEANKKTYEEFVAIKTSGQWSASAYYVRNMSNVTIKAAPGATVTVAGLTGGSGHVYGESYDYVLDKAYTSGSAYYLTQNWSNITIEGITFTAPANIASSLGTTLIDGVIFKNCIFNIGNTTPGNQALRYYNENNDGRVKNLTVDDCSFYACYQGVYTQKINGVTVINSSFNITGHNAIAVQSGSEPVNHKAVVITGNTFENITDRIIRFGSVGADTQITIKNNTATDSGDSSGEVMKAQSLAEGVTYNISGNNWGEGKTVANTELRDR